MLLLLAVENVGRATLTALTWHDEAVFSHRLADFCTEANKCRVIARAARIQVFAQLCVAELIQRALCGAYTGVELVAADFFVGLDLLTPIRNLLAPGFCLLLLDLRVDVDQLLRLLLAQSQLFGDRLKYSQSIGIQFPAFRRSELVFLRRRGFLILFRFFRSFLIGFLFRVFFCRDFFGRLAAFLFSFAFGVATLPELAASAAAARYRRLLQ